MISPQSIRIWQTLQFFTSVGGSAEVKKPFLSVFRSLHHFLNLKQSPGPCCCDASLQRYSAIHHHSIGFTRVMKDTIFVSTEGKSFSPGSPSPLSEGSSWMDVHCSKLILHHVFSTSREIRINRILVSSVGVSL